jgi:hypothetical protein
MVLGMILPASAHDLITTELAERYLARATADLEKTRPRESPARRAEAYYDLGRLVDEIRELLNRDIAMHGKVQGLPSNYLVAQLQARAVELKPAPDTGRFGPGVSYYRSALDLDPDTARGDAAYRLLVGEFYDGFDADPLATRWPWPRLQEHVRLAERLRARQPAHPELEEIEFILTVVCLQSARAAPDRDKARTWSERGAREAASFRRRFPDSMRVSALEVLVKL